MILIGACVSTSDFRNNEKRKEKSRDAARTRRSRETEIFSDLGEALPLSKEEVEQLDKASVMRLAIAYLKVRDMVDTGEWELRSNDLETFTRRLHCYNSFFEFPLISLFFVYFLYPVCPNKDNNELDHQQEDVKPSPDSLLGNESEQMLIKALDGFLLVLSDDGDITYVSENVTELLGLQQVGEEDRDQE